MARHSSLERWSRAGLITPEQVEAIEAFEADRTKDTGLKVFTRIGAFAIALGIISLVAANWDDIPGRVKLLLDLVIGGGIAWVAARQLFAKPGPAHESQVGRLTVEWREAGIVVLMGWTLASIALVSQVYQLGGHWLDAMWAWVILTAPLALHSRSPSFYSAWILLWQLALTNEAVRRLEHVISEEQAVLLLALVPLVPLVLIALAGLTEKRLTAFAEAARRIAALQWLVFASIGTLAFYEGPKFTTETPYWLAGAAVTGVALIAFLLWRLPKLGVLDARGRISVWVAGIWSWGCIFLPALTGVEDAGFLNAFAFCVLWFAVAWTGAALRWRWLVNGATRLVGLRLLIVYGELFADLLTTGLGLIISGVLLLVLVRLWVKNRNRVGVWLGLPEEEKQS